MPCPSDISLTPGAIGQPPQNTTRRSSLRLQRESELLGGIFSSELSRENIVLRAKFLRDDLPYFVEALGDVLTKTKYICTSPPLGLVVMGWDG